MNKIKDIFFYKHTFDEIEKVTETVRGWELELFQLDKGKFSGDLMQAGNNLVILTYFKSNRKIEMRGKAPKQMITFGIPLFNISPIIWQKHTITEKRVQTYKPGAELNGITPPGFETFTISIAEIYFDELVKTIGDDNNIYLNIENESLMCDEENIDRMHNFLNRFNDIIKDEQSGSSDDQFRRIIEVEIPGRLIDLISSGIPVKLKPSSAQRNLALKKFAEYINEFSDDRLTVLDFCRRTGVGKRTLEYAVQEQFNNSPKKYINALRLNNVKKELRNSYSSSTKVIDVANQHGFWHMGQFAKDYKLMFGELPSDTLNSFVQTLKISP
jgi:AraC family transcriptional regulator, ethanolamine operon transcriptional activator